MDCDLCCDTAMDTELQLKCCNTVCCVSNIDAHVYCASTYSMQHARCTCTMSVQLQTLCIICAVPRCCNAAFYVSNMDAQCHAECASIYIIQCVRCTCTMSVQL